MTLRDALLRGRRRPRRSAEGSPLQYRGDGYEFVELREYMPGDDVRHIDWAATARTAQLQTRVMLEDVALTLGVVIDDSASMQMGRHRPLSSAAEDIRTTWLSAALRSDRTRELQSLPEALALPRGSALLFVCGFECHCEVSNHGRGIEAQRSTLHELAHRLDTTVLIARDPWQDDLPLSGFVRIQDAQSGATQQLFIGKRERERYYRASREREARAIAVFEDAGWRTAIFTENDDGHALLRAFGIA